MIAVFAQLLSRRHGIDILDVIHAEARRPTLSRPARGRTRSTAQGRTRDRETIPAHLSREQRHRLSDSCSHALELQRGLVSFGGGPELRNVDRIGLVLVRAHLVQQAPGLIELSIPSRQDRDDLVAHSRLHPERSHICESHKRILSRTMSFGYGRKREVRASLRDPAQDRRAPSAVLAFRRAAWLG